MKTNQDGKLIFSTDFYDYYNSYEELSDSYKEYLEANDIADEPYTSDDVWNMFNEENSFDYNYFNELISKVSNDIYIVEYDHGRWNGRCKGFAFDKRNLSDIVSELSCCEADMRMYYDKDGVLCLDTGNHDASSYYKFYVPTELGLEYLYNRSRKYDPKSLAKVLIEVETFHKNVIINL